jgi:hypothetical protein
MVILVVILQEEYPQDRLGICTNNYSYAENFLIKKALKEILDLEFNISEMKYPSGLQYRLILRSGEIPKFVDGIKQYIVPSFEYKLIQNHTGHSIYKNMDEDIV